MFEGVKYALGFPPEAAGVFRASIFASDFVRLENHGGIADMKPECVKVYAEKRIFAVFGENLTVEEFDAYKIEIKGKILRTEYLT